MQSFTLLAVVALAVAVRLSQGAAQQILYLRVETAKIVVGPALKGVMHFRVNPEEK